MIMLCFEKRMLKFRLLLLSPILLLGFLNPSVSYGKDGYPQITTSARQLLLIDLSSRTVLAAKSANMRMYPASMTKMMTAYIVFEHLRTGFIDMDTLFRISYKARQMKGSRMFLEQGTNVDVEELLYGLVVQSGNDAAVALAEGISGSESDFTELMNAKAKEIDMENTNFANASGWPDENHYTTAWDLAILAKRTIEDFPELYKIYAVKSFTYGGIKQDNRNPLLLRDLGVDGLKTGHTDASGYGLVTSAKQEERRIIMVVNGLKNEGTRRRESERVLRWGFNAWKNVQLFSEGTLVQYAPIVLGKNKTIPLLASQNINITIPTKSTPKLTGYIEYKAPLAAPIKRDDVIGVLVINEDGEEVIRSPVIAAQDVKQTGFLGRLTYNFWHLF